MDRTVWGVRAAQTATDLAERCSLYAARLRPDAFFSHRTAAALHGIPLPPSRSDRPLIDVSVPAPERAPHAEGLIGHSLLLDEADVELLRGLRVTSAPRTWFDLAKLLPVPDLVAAGDRIISQRDPLAGITELTAMAENHPGERGIRRLLAALALLDGHAESPQESRLRAILVSAGLPRPAVNPDIADSSGRFLARGDLVWPLHRLVIEYQGDYHRERSQWRSDMTRRARLEAAGWRVLEVNADDLASPQALVGRVRAILAQ